jgi:hypothetical protein
MVIIIINLITVYDLQTLEIHTAPLSLSLFRQTYQICDFFSLSSSSFIPFMIHPLDFFA